MKNLQNYGVHVLNAKEVRETEGETPWYVAWYAGVAVVLTISAAVDEINVGIDWYKKIPKDIHNNKIMKKC